MLSLLALLWVPVAAEHSDGYAEKIPADGGDALPKNGSPPEMVAPPSLP